MNKAKVAKLIDQMPSNPTYERLNKRQLEYLTDEMIDGHDDTRIPKALLLIMDEVERLSLISPRDIEAVTVIVKRRAFHRMHETERREQALIAVLRGRLALGEDEYKNDDDSVTRK